LKLILCDQDPEVVAAWRIQFARHPAVEIRQGSIFEAGADALVNLGNSFGFMDGGLALQISERFGFGLEESVRQAIREKYGGEMLVGQAELFPTGGTPRFLVYAPAQRSLQPLRGTINPYLAARAALKAVAAHKQAAAGPEIGSLVFPGMPAGAGKMPVLISAFQLRHAYEEATGLKGRRDQNLSRLIRREKKLRMGPQPKGAPATAEGEEPD
jgi:O-acetyl-ADP-ribose deacetylase (regulator of RNase III)